MKDEPARKKLLVELMYITRPTIVLRRVGRIELLRAAVLEMVPEVRFLPHASGKLTIVVSDAESYENAYAVVTGVIVDFARS